MSVAYSQVASNRGRQRYCTLVLWRPWYKRPKQQTQSHATAVSRTEDLATQAAASYVVVVVMVLGMVVVVMVVGKRAG